MAKRLFQELLCGRHLTKATSSAQFSHRLGTSSVEKRRQATPMCMSVTHG